MSRTVSLSVGVRLLTLGGLLLCAFACSASSSPSGPPTSCPAGQAFDVLKACVPICEADAGGSKVCPSPTSCQQVVQPCEGTGCRGSVVYVCCTGSGC